MFGSPCGKSYTLRRCPESEAMMNRRKSACSLLHLTFAGDVRAATYEADMRSIPRSLQDSSHRAFSNLRFPNQGHFTFVGSSITTSIEVRRVLTQRV
jgi:hypothetical protein